MNTDRYNLRGVSSQKEDVHKAIKNLDKGLYPNAFCKIIGNIYNSNEDIILLHSDTAGTKPTIAYLYWKETGDISVFRNIVQDAIVMNTDDILCTGTYNNFILNNTLGRNKHLIPGEVVSEIISGTQDFINNMKQFDINIISAGGETADVGDLIKTIDVGFTVFAMGNKNNIIDTGNIEPGLVIVGLSSSGKSIYETQYNSGIGSNGLTSCKHDILNKYYKDKYPETYDSSIPEDLIYSGEYKITDPLPGSDINIGQAILSPTRTFLPVMKDILNKHKKKISGIIHCTGGGQTKCLKFGNGIHYIKDNLLPIPPLFKLLNNKTNTREMYQVFNMGTRLEIYTNKEIASDIIKICQDFHIDAQIIGFTEKSSTSKNKLTIKTDESNYYYE